MDTATRQDIANRIGNIDMEPGRWYSDNLAVAIVEYWERHPDKPEDSPRDDERCGWTVWALERADATLSRIAEELFGKPT